MSGLAAAAGFLRSLGMYHGIPFRKCRLKRFYAQFIRQGDLCFDIGAHAGNRTQALLSAGARVVALEPQPGFARLLRLWFRGNPALKILPWAVGASDGFAELHISDRTPTVTTLSAEWIRQVSRSESFSGVSWNKKFKVRIVTLDHLTEQFGEPVFCKIDVEGYEHEVLQGLSRAIPVVSFEYIPASLQIAIGCIHRLQEIGDYLFNSIAGESVRFQSGSWLKPDDMIQEVQSYSASSRPGDIYAIHSEYRRLRSFS